MPRVWLCPNDDGSISIYPYESGDGMPVDMNASLLRQIKDASRKYWKFQQVLNKFYSEAVEHPDTVRRVR